MDQPDLLTLLTNISQRLEALEARNEDIVLPLDNSFTATRSNRRGSSTLHHAENYQLQERNIQYTNTLQLPTFDNTLNHLKPRSIIKFTAAAHTYECTNNIKANLSKAFSYEVQQMLISSSNGTYNSSTIGTITLDKFIKISRQHMQVHTQAQFLTSMNNSSRFPNATAPMTTLNLQNYPTFRNMLKQYAEEFLMLLDLFSFNTDMIPPINNLKEQGLIHQFNKKIPYGFGEGVYRQIGFTNSIRRTYNTMNDYINDFNNKVDNFYDCTTKVQPLFDAILDSASTPTENKTKQFNKTNNNQKILMLNDNSEDELTSLSAASISNSIKSTIKDEAINLLSPPGVKKQPIDVPRPCHKKAIDGICKNPDCTWNHNKDIIDAYRDEVINKLTKMKDT